MKTIWKTSLTEGVKTISVPTGAELLTAREQGDQLCVWFRCDPDQPREDRRVEVCGTGWPDAPEGRYLGSGHFNDGTLVFHVFETSI